MMKRIGVLLPLAVAACGGGQAAAGSCQERAEIAIALEAPGGVSSAQSLEVSLIGSDGTRHVQTVSPPPPLASLTLQPERRIAAGTYQIKVIATTGGRAKEPLVSSLSRTSQVLTGSCDRIRLTLARPSALDLCMEACDADARCGKIPSGALFACEEGCQAAREDYADLWAKWQREYQHPDALLSELLGCRLLACPEIETCGEAALLGAARRSP